MRHTLTHTTLTHLIFIPNLASVEGSYAHFIEENMKGQKGQLSILKSQAVSVGF